MQGIMQNGHSVSVDESSRPPLVSNRLGEPMALFAVPLPSSSKSDFLCLCKRLFWSVGTSYFSAFCPLTAQETRLLPHSSAVVQLVSVTPALPTVEDGKPHLKQDLLAYTLSGDIVGIPYVAISNNHHPKGRLAKAFPFDNLASSAWVPAINAPFVGSTNDGEGVGPKKDVFIIKNDEKTRQSLLKGENVIFSQNAGHIITTQETRNKPASEPLQEQAISQNSPRKENSRSANVSLTSSSLYKSYNSSKRGTENGMPISPTKNGLVAPTKEPTPAAPMNCLTDQPAMVLPRIDAVFSLADATSTNGSLSKKIADTLAKLPQSLTAKTSTPVESGMTSKDALLQHGDGSLPKSQLTNFPKTSLSAAIPASEVEESRSVTTRAFSTPTATSSSGTVQSFATSLESTRQPNVDETASAHPVNAIPCVETDGGVQEKLQYWKSEITQNGPVFHYSNGLESQARSARKSSGATVAQLLSRRRRQVTSPVPFPPSTSVPAGTRVFQFHESVYCHADKVADVTNPQPCLAIQKNSNETNTKTHDDGVGIAMGCVKKVEAICPREESEKVKVPPLKMVIKTERDSDNKVKTTCHPVGEKPADFAGKVPCLKLHKLDISLYSFVDPDLIVQSECESKENVTSPGRQEAMIEDKYTFQSETIFGGHIRSQLTAASNVDTIGVPENGESLAFVTNGSHQIGKHEKKKRKRRRFRLTLSKRYKPSYQNDRPIFQRKMDTPLWDGREHLSECQNTLLERAKQHVPGDLSCKDVSAFGDDIQGEPNSHEPSKTQVIEDYQNQTEGSGKQFASDVPHTSQNTFESPDDLWSDESSSTDSEWECPDKRSAEVDSDWDSSLEDEVKNSPFKNVQPIHSSPFGDLQHMVLQDRLRLLEQTLKEHRSALNAIKQPHTT